MAGVSTANWPGSDHNTTVHRKKTLRVLHLITWLRPGGIEKWLLEMLEHVRRTECSMDICCKGRELGSLAAVARDLGALTYLCPMTMDHFSFARRLSRILMDGSYDILHNHVGAYSGFPVWIARRTGVRVITSYHNTHFAPQTMTRLPVLRELRAVYSRLSIGYAIRHSDLITGCSNSVLKSLVDPQRSADRHRVLYYGIRSAPRQNESARNAFRKALGYSMDTPLVLHVGRFFQQKNHLGLLQIWKRVLTRTPNARLLLVGDGLLRAAVERAAEELNLDGSVRFLGVRADVKEIMGSCDVFLFPSLHEGFGIAALEASGAELPVVGTNIPGLNEVVTDRETGLLHAIEDVEGMAASVSELLEERERGRKLGDAGRRKVREHFSAASSAERLLSLYHECLGLS